MLDLGEELTLGDGRGHRVRVPGVEQSLEHDPAVADVVVPREVDPAESAVREAAENLVLPGDQFAGHELGAEGEAGAALPAEPFGQAGTPVRRLADALPAVSAEPPALRYPRVGQDRRASGRAPGPAAPPPARPRARRARTGRCRPASRGCRACCPNPARPVPARTTTPDPWPPVAPLEALMGLAALAALGGARGRRRHAADRAVPVLDHSAAPRLCARGSRHRRPPSLVVVAWIARWYPATAVVAAARSHGAVHSRSRAWS